VIYENLAEIERHGKLHVVRAVSGERGPAANENFLNFENAMVLCTISRTPQAEDVRFVMIQVFSKVVNGDIAAAPRMELRALEVAADHIVAPILHEQREFHTAVLVRMDRHEGRILTVERELVDVKKTLSNKRLEFKDEDREIFLQVVINNYNGYCPCCHEIKIVEAGMFANAHIDHWVAPRKRKLQDGWPVCYVCNPRLYTDTEFKILRTKMPSRYTCGSINRAGLLSDG
jgi:hypothetical protein